MRTMQFCRARKNHLGGLMRIKGSRRAATWVVATIIAGGFGTASALAQSSSTVVTSSAANPDADNSKVNRRYDNKVETTADQQSNRKEAIETTRRIRSALVDDKSLSTYAHNVKIIWQHGEVFLKGPVNSAEEKLTVERIATKMAGNTKVKSELEVVAH